MALHINSIQPRKKPKKISDATATNVVRDTDVLIQSKLTLVAQECIDNEFPPRLIIAYNRVRQVSNIVSFKQLKMAR